MRVTTKYGKGTLISTEYHEASGLISYKVLIDGRYVMNKLAEERIYNCHSIEIIPENNRNVKITLLGGEIKISHKVKKIK